VFGLAVDWIHSLLYWTDSGRKTIEVCSVFDPNNTRAVLITEIYRPKAITINVVDSFIVWTNWEPQPKIEIAAQDGTNRKIIVEKRLKSPYGITVDTKEKRIYWVDGGLSTIYACDFDGKHRAIIFYSPDHLKDAFFIDVFDKTFYWSTASLGTLFSGYKISEMKYHVKEIVFNSKIIMDFKIVHKSKQPLSHNRCNVTKCSHLCLPHNKTCYVCICPVTYDSTSCLYNVTEKIPTSKRYSFFKRSKVMKSIISKPICSDTFEMKDPHLEEDYLKTIDI
ncbi:Very low-density lipoprotein receptor-like protein, partial [Leptotrombidium deliense]